MIRRAISISVIAALMAGSAQAVVLSSVEGVVSVSHGGGFGPALSGASVAPGDRIRTGDGSVSIVYENGCAANVGPHRLVAVAYAAPGCSSGGSLKDGVVVADTG